MTTTRKLGLLVVVATGVLAAAALVSAALQDNRSVTLTGCLRAGSSSGIYLLRGAAAPDRTSADTPDRASGAIPEDYLLVAIPDNVDLAPQVNHRLAVTGGVSEAKDPPPPPATANTAEKALKKLTVQSVKEVASNCAAF